MYIGLYAKHPLFLSDFNDACIFSTIFFRRLTLNLLTTTIVAPPSNASKWQMGFNSVFKGLTKYQISRKSVHWEPSCFVRTDGRTDGHDEANSRFSQFYESA
jgi:hypothetical protein